MDPPVWIVGWGCIPKDYRRISKKDSPDFIR
jgi:hypothetical protein